MPYETYREMCRNLLVAVHGFLDAKHRHHDHELRTLIETSDHTDRGIASMDRIAVAAKQKREGAAQL